MVMAKRLGNKQGDDGGECNQAISLPFIALRLVWRQEIVLSAIKTLFPSPRLFSFL